MSAVTERLDMIVAELQGLPHVVETCREAADRIATLEAEVVRLRAIIRDDDLAFKMIDVGQDAVPDHWRFRCDARKIASIRRAALAAGNG